MIDTSKDKLRVPEAGKHDGVTPSKYKWQDHLVADLARFYSEESDQPFLAAIGKHDDFDLQSVSGEIIIEVKCETSSIRTNNVALEYWNTDFDCASGFLSTKAGIWLHIALQKEGFIGYEIEIDKLRGLAIESGVVKSNGRNSLCKIVSLDNLRPIARRSFDLTKIITETRKGELYPNPITLHELNITHDGEQEVGSHG